MTEDFLYRSWIQMPHGIPSKCLIALLKDLSHINKKTGDF